MANKTLDEIIQELKCQLEDMGIKPYDRQHGRKGIEKENEEEEKKRLRNNLASQLSRAKKRRQIIDKNKAYNYISPDLIEDENGINKVDERRFKQCFVYEDIAPEYDYVRRMTGLNIDQISILEQKYKMFCAKTL